jgi:hypothetical protein
MKKVLFYILWLILTLKTAYFGQWWVALWYDMKSWSIHIEDIPDMIRKVIDFWVWLAWTVAIIAIIFWAYQILFWWLTEWSKTKWKQTITAALIWLAIALLARFIIRLLIDNLQK